MRRHIVILTALLTAGALRPAAAQTLARPGERPSFSAPAGPKYAPDRLLVKFRAKVSSSSMAAANAKVGATPIRQFASVSKLQLVRLPAGTTVQQALAQYRGDPSVQYAEPDYVLHAVGTVPNDPQFGSLWGLQNTGQSGGTPHADIDATEAWDLSTGDQSVVVGVIDTGVDYNHQDLSANIFQNVADCNNNGIDDDGNGYVDDCHGINPIYGNSDPFDDFGHGTHVSGTIGAIGDNSVGVVGVNWHVTILPCKFLDSFGNGLTSAAVACLDYMAVMKDRGLNIVATNNSWGGGGFSLALYDAIRAQMDRGILFVAAAGNGDANGNGLDNDVVAEYPGDFDLPNIIAVAATDRNDNLATFSNFGAHTVGLGAPGVAVLSTFPGNQYQTFDGTSMATPHVTGTAALLKANDPSLDWRAIKNRILAGGDVKPAVANTISQRRLNAFGALTCSNSVVQGRLRPTTSELSATSGTVIPLEYLDINCAAPSGPATVTVSPGSQTVTLQDDGVAPDLAAGDGVYSGEWVAQAPGISTLTFPNNDALTVTVLLPYSYQSAPYSYRTLPGTNLNLSDDSVAAITSPFPIQFGGTAFNTFYVSSNGTISLDSGFDSPQNFPLPFPGVSTLIAPWWDDLMPQPGTNQNVFWAVTGSAPDRELVVEWRDVPHYAVPVNLSETVTFEVVFQESSGNILFNYLNTVFAPGFSCNNGACAVVGIQVAPNEGNGLAPPVSLASGSAILWQLGTDFFFSVLNTPQKAFLGTTATFFGGITPQNGFDASVVVSCDGADAPTTCNSVTVNSQGSAANYSLPVSYSVAGDHTFNIKGVGQDVFARTHSVPATLSVVDYALSVPNPATLSVLRAGSSAPTSLTVTVQGSAYSGSVVMSCDPASLPTDMTCAFSNSNLQPRAGSPATTNLTFNTTRNTPLGTYNVTVIARDFNAPSARTQTVQVNVLANPDFSLSATPPGGISSPVGSSGTTATVNVNSLDGFTSPVTLSCAVNSNASPAPTCTITSSPVTPPGSATLTLSSNGAAPGSYAVAVTGTSSDPSHTLNYSYGISDFTVSTHDTPVIAGNAVSPFTFANAIGGFSGTVTFQCDMSQVDPNATCSLNGQSLFVGLGGVDPLYSIFVPANVPSGIYTVTLHATSGPLSHDFPFHLLVSHLTITMPNQEATVVPGQILAPFDIALNADAGFSGTVSLHCVGPATCTFSPSSSVQLTGPGTVTVTVNATVSYGVGSGTLRVDGFIDSFTATRSTGGYLLDVQDYSLSVPGGSVIAGNTFQTTVTVNPLNGFSTPVTLSCVPANGNPAPPGFSCSIPSGTVPPGGSAPVTVSTTTAANGFATFEVHSSATVNGVTVSHRASFQVNAIMFSPTLFPGSAVAVQRGATAQYQLFIYGTAGPPYSVACVGLNPHFTCSLQAEGGTPYIYNVNIPTDAASPVGTQNFSINTTASDVTRSNPATLTVTDVSMTSSNLAPAPVLAGGSATIPLTVTALGGFGAQVSLSCPLLPTAVKCTFSPASTFVPSGAGTAVTLSMSTATTTPGGTYTVPIVMRSNNLGTSVTRTLNATLGVKSFHIAAVPAVVVVPLGGVKTITAAAFSDGGFGSSVVFSCTGPLPAGIGCAFSPGSVIPTPGGTGSILTISAAPNAFAGSSTLNVTGTSGAITSTQPVTLLTGDAYLLSVANPTVTTYVGQTAVFNAAATAFGAYSSPVNLNCAAGASFPPASCMPSPNPVVPSGAGTAFTVSAGGAAGDYNFNLHGVGTDPNTLAVSVPMALHLVDFSLGATPNPVSIPQGTASNVVLTVTAAGTFTDSVSVACRTPLPAGVACSYSQNDFVPSNSGTVVTLTISTMASTPLGASLVHVDVTGSSPGAPTKTQDITLNVTTGPPALGFIPVTPCRVADTRNATGPYGGPALVGGASRDFPLSSQSNPTNPCGIPATAQAYSLNLTVVPHGLPLGFVTAYPCGQTRPLASNLNSDGRVKAVAAIVPAGTNGDVCIYASSGTDLVVDINGYFVSTTDPSPPLAFYPVTPCRLVDTRNPDGSLGGPTLVGGATRTFPLLSGSCGIPATAQAYSLNYTVVPRQAVLSFLTTWPAGQSQPLVSTLNATTGVVTANAAIVPAGTSGDVNVFVTQNTDLVIDVNGYFAPAGAGGLSLYVLTPCRALDTRNGGGSPFSGQLDLNVVAAGCGAPVSAQALVLNATAVPPAVLSFLTLWPQGVSRPLASTTNSVDGSVVSNLAIVPTTNGSISAYAGSSTQLVVDISAFFAP